MHASRCKDCGDTRWSLLGAYRPEALTACQMCGGEMLQERRSPGHFRGAKAPERRHTVTSGAGTLRPSL
jgi:predicted nucleic acid-binding Zn ribbon protein